MLTSWDVWTFLTTTWRQLVRSCFIPCSIFACFVTRFFAEQQLSFAYRCTPKDDRKHRSLILRFLVPCKLLLYQRPHVAPTRGVFRLQHLSSFDLQIYQPILTSCMSGALHRFEQVLQHEMPTLVKWGVWVSPIAWKCQSLGIKPLKFFFTGIYFLSVASWRCIAIYSWVLIACWVILHISNFQLSLVRWSLQVRMNVVKTRLNVLWLHWLLVVWWKETFPVSTPLLFCERRTHFNRAVEINAWRLVVL